MVLGMSKRNVLNRGAGYPFELSEMRNATAIGGCHSYRLAFGVIKASPRANEATGDVDDGADVNRLWPFFRRRGGSERRDRPQLGNSAIHSMRLRPAFVAHGRATLGLAVGVFLHTRSKSLRLPGVGFILSGVDQDCIRPGLARHTRLEGQMYGYRGVAIAA